MATSSAAATATTPPADRRQPLNLRSGAFAFLLSTLWAGNPVSIKAGLEDAPPLRLGWMRFVLGAVVVLIWAIATRQSLKPTRSELWPLTTLGVLFSVQLAFMNIGQNFTTGGHAVIVLPTFPLWAAVFAHIFVPGDSLTRGRSIGIIIAYSGVVAIFVRGLVDFDPALLRGDALLLGSAILLGLRQVYMSQMAQGISQPKLLVAQSIFGTVSFVAASLLFESGDAYRWTATLAIALIYQGVVIAGFGFIGQTWLLKNYLPSRVTVISLSQPVIGVILSWLILGEAIGPELYVGAALVVVGSYMAQRRGRRSLPADAGAAD